MECKKIQEWLITDHLDGELGPEEGTAVRQHLKDCATCRDFMLAVQGTAGVPFQGLSELQPDPIVWRKVRGILEAEEARSGGWLRNFDRTFRSLMQPLPAFRVVFAAAMVFAVIVLAKWPFNQVDPAYAYVEEQMTFVEDLRSGDPDVLNGDTAEYGLPFEESAG